MRSIIGPPYPFVLGEIRPFAHTSPPGGWLACDGSAVSRTTYAGLFGKLSTNFGAGDGSTTFNLPDLRGRAPIGNGQGSGLTNRALGASGGTEGETLAESQIPAHAHNADVRTPVIVGPPTFAKASTNDAGAETATTATAGGGGSHNNMMPFLAIAYYIWAGG